MIFYYIDYEKQAVLVTFLFEFRLSTNGIINFKMVSVEVNNTYMAVLVNLVERCHDIDHNNTY